MTTVVDSGGGLPCAGARCDKCGHIWVIAYLPMDMKTVSELAKRAMCPSCGNKKVAVARTAEIEPVYHAMCKLMMERNLPR